MPPEKKQLRVASIVSAIIAVAPFGALINHELVNGKPYKIVSQPLQAALESAAGWLPIVIFGIAVAVGALSPIRHGAVLPLLAVVAASLVALGSILVITLSAGQSLPASGDFGTNAVIATFSRFTLLFGFPSLCIAALLGWIIKVYRAWRVAAV